MSRIAIKIETVVYVAAALFFLLPKMRAASANTRLDAAAADILRREGELGRQLTIDETRAIWAAHGVL